MRLLDLLRTYPGGLVALAEAAELSPSAVYRFAWKANKRVPAAIASKLATAIANTTGVPENLKPLGDLETLLAAWIESEPGRVRDTAVDR